MASGFTHLRTFHAVAEHRGFTAAAAVLGIGQPTVTTQIKELEERYGVELLLRKGRRIDLTEAGAALLEITRRMIKLHEDAHELLLSHGRFDLGHLRLAAVGPFHATDMIAAYRRSYPSMQVSVLLGNSDQTWNNLLELRADIAILAQVADDPRVHSSFYRSHEVVVFVHSEHPWFERNSVSLKELAGQPFVLRERGSTTRHAFEQAVQAAGIAIEPVLEIGSREGVWKAVAQGLGIGVVADFEFVPHPNLRTLPISDVSITTEYRLACLQERQNSRKIRSFLAVVDNLRTDRPPASRHEALISDRP